MFDTVAQEAERLLATLTPEAQLGQMMMAVHAPDWPGYTIEPLLESFQLGSVISCGYRHLDLAGGWKRNAALQQLALQYTGLPLLNGGDFEQGLPTQMSGGTDLPSQMGLGATWSEAMAADMALIAGRELRAVGFHWPFSPVADVNTNPANPVIGTRSFGSDTEEVARLVAAQVPAFQNAGVLATPKHFPGHGAAGLDSHQTLPVIDLDEATWRAIHLPPFLAAFAAGAATLMTAHVLLPALDPHLPATLSPRILTGLLRDELGFDGVIVTDQMTMRGVTARWKVGEAAVLSVLAGADVIMAGGDSGAQAVMFRALLDALADGTLSRERVQASARRVLQAKVRLGLIEQPVGPEAALAEVRSPQALADSAEAIGRSVVLLRNDGLLPFARDDGQVTLVAGVTNGNTFGPSKVSHVEDVAAMVGSISGAPTRAWAASSENPTDAEIASAVAAASSTARILVFTYARGSLAPGQAALVQALAATGKPLAAIATGTPYDLASYPTVRAALACFALSFAPMHLDSTRVLETAIQVVFGLEPSGRLPVAIPGIQPVGTGVSYRGPIPLPVALA